LIRPQEKHRNLRRDKDSNDFFHEVLPLVKIPSKLIWEEAFHRNFIGNRVHSSNSKDFVGKIPIEIKSSKIHMNFL
jgi:hypothetical protein